MVTSSCIASPPNDEDKHVTQLERSQSSSTSQCSLQDSIVFVMESIDGISAPLQMAKTRPLATTSRAQKSQLLLLSRCSLQFCHRLPPVLTDGKGYPRSLNKHQIHHKAVSTRSRTSRSLEAANQQPHLYHHELNMGRRTHYPYTLATMRIMHQ